MAEQLIASMESEYDPDQYRDEYREALMAVIEAKVAGQKPEPAKKAEPTRIGDLMAALEASVAAARESRRSGGEKEAEEKPASGKAKGKKAATKKAAPRKAAARGRGKSDEEAEEAPARRRKTA
jgi:DNA end-binding protein Ku